MTKKDIPGPKRASSTQGTAAAEYVPLDDCRSGPLESKSMSASASRAYLATSCVDVSLA